MEQSLQTLAKLINAEVEVVQAQLEQLQMVAME
jgi:hypothetical protein